jgi:hypothetical protein
MALWNLVIFVSQDAHMTHQAVVAFLPIVARYSSTGDPLFQGHPLIHLLMEEFGNRGTNPLLFQSGAAEFIRR